MSQPELLKLVVQRLAAAGIEYMVSGSVASSLQGEPRATHDFTDALGVYEVQHGRLDEDYLSVTSLPDG